MMCWTRKSIFNNRSRYRDHHKLVVYRHYIVYFINGTKHIEDVAPDIRKTMIASNYEPDVVFLVDGLKFPAHKRVLRISNEPFYIQHVEPHENKAEISIDNVNSSGFQQFLRFCHFGDLNLNSLNMMPTYDVAENYNHSRLIAQSTDFICDNIKIENVLEVLDWNLHHQNYQILRCSRAFFIENAIKVLSETDQFQKISKDLLQIILGLDVLNCSEKLLFNKTLEWAEEQCRSSRKETTKENVLDMLEDLLHLIRLEISTNLEVTTDFPTNPRANRFSKQRFDNLFIQSNIEETWEEIAVVEEDVTCYGFSIILSNPDSMVDSREHFMITIESGNELILQKEFNIKVHEYLAIKDFVFELPIVIEKFKRYILKVKFICPKRLRFMEKDDSTGESCSRLLRLYD